MGVTLNPDNSFVGRATEIASLVGRFQDAASGRGGVALLSGEPGIGKTRLARAFTVEAESRDALVLWGRCFEGEWSPPLTPWVEVIGSFVRSSSVSQVRLAVSGSESSTEANPLSAIVPELAPFAQGLPAIALLGVEEDRVRLHDAVVRLFTYLSAEQPVVIVLEDLHWADGASLDLLRHLAYFAVNSRLLIVGTYRDLELSPGHPLQALLPALRRDTGASPIVLRGLTERDVESLIGGVSPTPWSARLAHAITVETKGNPFFIEELLRHLVDEAQSTGGGDWSVSGDFTQIAVPEGVRQVVNRRLSRLSEETQRLLTHASIFTGGVDFAVLQAMLDQPEDVLLDALDEALAARMLEPASAGVERYDFVHSIVRHTLSETWSPSRRVRLHRRAAEALSTAYVGREREHAGELAVQYHCSASLPGASAGIPFALQAADHASTAFAREAIVNYLRIARDLAISESADRRASILCRLAIAEAEAVLASEAQSTAEEALAALQESASEPEKIADFVADLTKALKQNAYVDSRIWRPMLERGLKLVRENRGRAWAKLMLLNEPVVPVSREVVRAGRWAGFDPEAVNVARLTGDEEDYARSFESFDPRTREETDALADRARTWNRAAAVMYGLTVAANDYHYRHGAFRDAQALWTELTSMSARYGAINWQAQALNQMTWLQIAFGQFAQAKQSEEQANVLLARLGPGRRSHVLAMEMATSFAIYLGGDWPEIASFWSSYVDEPGLGPADLGTLAGTLYGALAAYAFAEAGNAEAAERLLGLLIPILGTMPANETNHNGAVGWAGAAIWRLGKTEHAAALRRYIVDLINSGFGDYPQLSNQLTLARMNALVGTREEATEAFQLARRNLERSGQRPLNAIAALDFASMLSRGGPAHYGQVVELLDESIATFEELGMSPWLVRAQLARSEAETRLGGRSQLPAGLTEREADVLKLVARGYSDRQISDELYISPRTVNAHLRNMLNKTSVANRTELSIWAFEHGLVTRDEAK